MDKIKLVKFALNFTVAAGTAQIIRTLVFDNMRPRSAWGRYSIMAATSVFASLIVRIMKAHAELLVDESVENWEKLKASIFELQATIAGED